MRNFMVAAFVLTLALTSPPTYAAGTQQPLPQEPSEPGCQWCEYDSRYDSVKCEPGGTDWFNCKGGWIYLPDGSGESGRVPDCGQRCYYA